MCRYLWFVLLVAISSNSYVLAEPKSPPPTEWRGVTFGKTLDELRPVILENFSKVKFASDVNSDTGIKFPVVTAETKIRDKSVDVEFKFHPESNELWEIKYSSGGETGSTLDVDNILVAFTELYGEPSENTDIMGGISISTWDWPNSSFEIIVLGKSGDRVSVTTVSYLWRGLASYFAEKKKEAAKEAAGEY